MANRNAERLQIAQRARTRFAGDQILTPLQARAFVRSLQVSWQVQSISWQVADSQEAFSQAERLIHAATVLSELPDGNPQDAAVAYRRAGEIFEWLSRSKDQISDYVPLALCAAGAYQLGGLPAMASGVLKQTSSSDLGHKLFASFLSGDFDNAIRQIADFWSENPDLTRANSGSSFFKSDSVGDLAWMATVELVRCIGLASHSLRRGDQQRFERALGHLRRTEKLLSRMATDDVAHLAFFLRATCESYGRATIYGPLRELAVARPERLSFMNLFARKQFARGRGILWQSQHQGLGRLISNSSFALCTPTGSGKTLIANLAIVKELLLNGEGPIAPLALYIVPSRALAGEVEAKLTGELGRSFIVTGLYGGSDWGVTDAWLTSDVPTVLIATVEKADALMRYLGPNLLARLRLLIVDEAHQVVVDDTVRERENIIDHSSRAARLESFVSRLLARKPEVFRIALTAVAGGAAHPVAKWIESNETAQAVGTYYRSTRQAVGVIEIRPNGRSQILLDMLNERFLSVRGRDAGVYIDLKIDPMPSPPVSVRNSVNHYVQNSILWTALHLLDSDRKILISIAQRPEDTIQWYAEAFELKGWEVVPSFQPPTLDSYLRLYNSAILACIDYCGPESYELALLRRGIATNHGQMPQRLRRLMVALVDRSICKITVATATLTEGVNLPFDIIILPSITRKSFDPSTNQQMYHPMSTAEFKNLSGRAGRPGASRGLEGITLVAIAVSPPATAASQRPLQERQIAVRRAEYDNLLLRLSAEAAGVAQHSSPLALLLRTIYEKAVALGLADAESFFGWLARTAPTDVSPDAGTASQNLQARLADGLDELDGVLLSAIEELRSVAFEEAVGIDAEATLARVWQGTFARYAYAYENWMEQAFVQRGSALIQTIYPNAEERKQLYSFGYSPQIGRRFRPVADQIIDIIHYADNYGLMENKDRFDLFHGLGGLIANDRGFGFAVKSTALGRKIFERWPEVFAWWMDIAAAPSPSPDELRSWQSFVSDNFEFRLGVAIGAAVSKRWTEGSPDAFSTPTLDNWKETTDLPWLGFWAKELLRWGTLEPFVAFAMSQGLAGTRREAYALRDEFLEWFRSEALELTAESLIDPRIFTRWQRARPFITESIEDAHIFEAKLSDTDGRAGRYSVIPVFKEGRVAWIDASGYELAVSHGVGRDIASVEGDYELTTLGNISVSRVF